MSSSTNDLRSECALLVVSCDAYADLWTPFFKLLRKYWPDCPFEIYLGAEILTYNDPSVTTLHSDLNGKNWSGRLFDYLNKLSCERVLIMLDDFFLRGTVQTEEIFHSLKFAKGSNAIQVRLIPRPAPTDKIKGELLIGKSAAGSPYRLCTQAAIWDRRELKKLLSDGETIWEFEINGNERIRTISEGFYAVKRSVLPYDGWLVHHVIEKGKWFPHEKRSFERQDVGVDFAARGTLSTSYVILYQAAETLDRSLSFFPWRVKMRIKRLIKGLLRPMLSKHFAVMRGTKIVRRS